MIRPVPFRLQKRITEIGGLAPNGKSLFRVIRGCDRMTWIGGKWKKYDEHGNEIGEWVGMQEVPKYPSATERYVFELLCPAENYGTPEEWRENFTQWIDGQSIDTLGPFPRSGEYELVRVLETPTTKSFVPLTEAICDAVVAVAKLKRELPERIKREAAKERRDKEEAARQQRLVDRINDMSVSPVMRKPHIVVPDMSEIEKFS